MIKSNLDAFALAYRWLEAQVGKQTKPLNTFTEALEAFRTAMSYRFFDWLTLNRDLFASYKDSLGYI
ncbi:hypothetical protein [Nostoc sp. MG11]|uniref:hypothetical protein n=1 Tax=Nostoc sp. MG11 TaxID=2721166 RepID=UPI0039B6EBDE